MASGTRRAIASILVVEDDEAIADVLLDILESEGYRARAACDGAGALGAMRAERFDLVLLDFCLPDMTGRDVRDQQLADAAIAQVPVIVLTAGALTTVDALPVIRKPFDCDELLQSIRDQLDIAEAARHRTLLAAVSDVRRQLLKSVDDLEAIRRGSDVEPPSKRRP